MRIVDRGAPPGDDGEELSASHGRANARTSPVPHPVRDLHQDIDQGRMGRPPDVGIHPQHQAEQAETASHHRHAPEPRNHPHTLVRRVPEQIFADSHPVIIAPAHHGAKPETGRQAGSVQGTFDEYARDHRGSEHVAPAHLCCRRHRCAATPRAPFRPRPPPTAASGSPQHGVRGLQPRRRERPDGWAARHEVRRLGDLADGRAGAAHTPPGAHYSQILARRQDEALARADIMRRLARAAPRRVRLRSVAVRRRRCRRRMCLAWCAVPGSWRRGLRGWCVPRWF